ncbi:uncharacterized protein ACWYII_009649 [Salvelinus alpinus]
MENEIPQSLGTKVPVVPLVTNASLLKLNLRDNWMEGMGGATMLKENCYITGGALPTSAPGPQGGGGATHTHLNQLPDRDAQHLAQALTSNTKLETLALSHNIMGDAAGDLYLSHNGLGKDGAVALGEALRENNTQEDINISNNRVPPEGAIR